ncbi:MAG: N-acetylmuramidase family protein [Halopseudomonas sp.]|uniref:N-acetylmuramidase family protein n=1 Tax=Halopseudomonas sp. TaxID=2901191 RepID=UPI00300226B9
MSQLLQLGSKGHAVRDLQAALTRAGYRVKLDGDFGPATESAIIALQRSKGLVVDGIAGAKTLAALGGKDCSSQLKEADLIAAADRLGVGLASIKAVNEVESRGEGFFAPGKPAILYERHVMHDLLSASHDAQDVAELAALHPNLISTAPGGYAGGVSEYPRLARARMIDAEAATGACSWGAFQIMGYHAPRLGYASAQAMADAMQQSEAEHLEAFVRFIEADPALHKALKARKWAAFAKGYNGPAYARNLYDVKLARAYARHRELIQGVAA